MPAKQNTPGNTYHEDLVREYLDHQAAAEPHLNRMEEIKKALRDLDYGTHTIAGMKVTLGKNMRMNAERFRAAYPWQKHPEMYASEPALDSKAIKENLAPTEIAKYQDEGEKRLGIK